MFRVESLELKVVESPAATILKYCERSEHINSQLSTINLAHTRKIGNVGDAAANSCTYPLSAWLTSPYTVGSHSASHEMHYTPNGTPRAASPTLANG